MGESIGSSWSLLRRIPNNTICGSNPAWHPKKARIKPYINTSKKRYKSTSEAAFGYFGLGTYTPPGMSKANAFQVLI